MSLEKYSAKRNFADTPEPKAGEKKHGGKLSFVVQRHKASHLHYDLRLEMNGVLKSWAVPKGPSLNPEDKRLAMMVEDHPFSYKDFKGVIPEGNYGAGIVEIWDKGFYSDIEKSPDEKKLLAGLKAGNLKFNLSGKKLKGDFALVKLKGKDENAWLLIKHNDKYAVCTHYDSEKETTVSSPINKWLASQEERRTAKKRTWRLNNTGDRKLSHFVKPMLAKETDTPFDEKGWVFEIKWDGYRAISEIKKDTVEIYSRNGISFKNDYPLLVRELQKLKHDLVIDGELVVLNAEGKPDFQKLQHYEQNTQYPLCYYAFDLLSLDGKNTCSLTLLERKQLLKKALGKNNVIRYSEHVKEDGIDFFNVAKKNKLEGIMAKKGDSDYQPGVRTNNWLKIKHHQSGEVIIAGFTEPAGSRKYLGALVLGVMSDGKLKYAGHAGGGFNDKSLEEVYRKLKPLIQEQSPFDEKIITNTPATWVKPILVAEVKFREWTIDGKMRHPIFLRIREDKKVDDLDMRKTSKQRTNSKKADSSGKIEIDESDNDQELVIGRTTVKTSNRNKIFWPKERITKGMVIDYYIEMADYILPYLKDRPESLKRNPNGILDKGFYHKDAGDEAPGFVQSISLYSASSKKDIEYILCNNKATLIYLANLGCIELNPWHSRIRSLDKPDYLIIDIDPSDKNTFNQVIEVANVFKDLFDKAGAPSYCKTSGATGLHVFVPMGKKYSYDQVRSFGELICTLAYEQMPSFTSMERNVKKRGNKHIYLDYLQNSKGQTIASIYSLRPHEGALASAPLQWKEVTTGLHPSAFNIYNMLKRVKKVGDIFSGVLGAGINMKTCLKKIGG